MHSEEDDGTKQSESLLGNKVFPLKVVEFLEITGFPPPSQFSWPGLACLLLCGNGLPVWFGSGWRRALGFIDNILLRAYERDSLSVFIAHFVVGSFSGTHDKFAGLYTVNPWLRGLKDDDCMLCSRPRLYFSIDFFGLVRLLYYLNFKLTKRAVDTS